MEFLPSSKISPADGLSRLIPKHTEPLEDTVIASQRTEVEAKNTLCSTVRNLPVTLSVIKEKAFDDDFIKEIKNKIKDKDRQISDSNSICNEVVMYSDHVVIPAVLQKRIQKEFHIGPPGMSKMKSLIRSYIYWSNMDRDIENIVKACKGYALAAKAPSIKLSPWPETDRSWSRIHIDFAGPLNGFYFLIVVDSFSEWSEIVRCKKATTEVVTSFLHELFARFGVVDCIVSDNGSHSCPVKSQSSFKHSQWKISRSLRINQEIIDRRNVSSIPLGERYSCR